MGAIADVKVDVITSVEFAGEASPLLALLFVTFFAVLDFCRVLIVAVAETDFTPSDVGSFSDGGGDASGEIFFGLPLFLANGFRAHDAGMRGFWDSRLQSLTNAFLRKRRELQVACDFPFSLEMFLGFLFLFIIPRFS